MYSYLLGLGNFWTDVTSCFQVSFSEDLYHVETSQLIFESRGISIYMAGCFMLRVFTGDISKLTKVPW